MLTFKYIRHFILVIMIFPSLSGCMILGAELESSYDPSIIVAGSTKKDIDSEIGRPKSVMDANKFSTPLLQQGSVDVSLDETVAFYEVKALTKGEKETEVNQIKFLDSLSFGLMEIFLPISTVANKSYPNNNGQYLIYYKNDVAQTVLFKHSLETAYQLISPKK